MHRWALAAILVLFLAGHSPADEPASPLFPFVLPWDDATPGVTCVSGWLPKPAGKQGPVHAGPDGHLYTGTERIRFLGVNLAFGANFPRHEDADKIAARMAKFGINVVRFHHMDMQTYPGGIRARNASGTGVLDATALDRLDYFIARLEEHGIYANLNLLVSRPFDRTDGLPPEIETVEWKDRHVAGFFHRPILKLQQEYAHALLTHRNPYTKRTYAEDPGVAFVEINNEDGLIQGWLGNQVDRLPEFLRRDLQRQWNAWLVKKYGSTEKLRTFWGARNEPLGDELLANADFRRGTERWNLERHEQAEAEAALTDELPPGLMPPMHSVRITVRREGTMAWHVQFNQAGLKLRKDQPYTLSFWAKADRPLKIGADVSQAHEPRQSLGLGTELALTREWQEFRFVFPATAGDDNARLNFTGLARQTATVWLAGVALRPGGNLGLVEGERLEDGSVLPFTHARPEPRTVNGQLDWLRFLWDTEDAYWQAMLHYLKDDLKVQGVVLGTIVGCSTPNLMARFEAADSHAYWQHPEFPSRQWDDEDWIVRNRTLVNEAGGILAGLAQRRILGRPHCVTEYNHAAPNTYSSEAFLLLAAYGALQDWDALYVFAYSHRTNDWDARRIQGFFDVDQHPTKMATLPAAAALFLRGDVQPARDLVLAAMDREQEITALRTAHAWDLVHAGTAGVSRESFLVHRVALATETGPHRKAPHVEPVKSGARRYESDTGELIWDRSNPNRGVVTVNTPRSKAVIGYGGGRRFDLGGVVLAPGASVQEGWSTLTLTVREGQMTKGPARLLLTIIGLAENTGMKWKGPAHESVGRSWGTAPSLVEGVPATVTLPVPAARVHAWALDARGQRGAALPVQEVDGKATLALGPGWKTLWYEVEVKSQP